MRVYRYKWDAKDYASNSANQYSWAMELIPKLHLAGGEAVLDIGCGDGKITAEIARCVPNGRVVGIDSSPAMIHLAKSKFTTEQYANLSFYLMDARALPFRGEFDVAFSNAALHWILDQKSVLAGVERSLKRRGRLLFQMAGKGNAAALYEVFDAVMATGKFRNYFEDFTFPYSYPTAQEYKQLLVGTGLEPIRLELTDNKMVFNCLTELTGSLRTTWLPYTERVPAQQRNSFVEDVVYRYFKRNPPQSDGSIRIEMKRLEVEAKKP